MAKASYLLLALVCLCTSVRASITDTAANYLHVREHGHNRGPEITRFLASVNIQHPAPWCAAYTNYVLQKAKVNHKMNGMASSCCPTTPQLIYNKGHKNFNKLPQAGDLFFWYRPGGGHTGIITQWPAHGDYFYTIEGNVSCADGRQGVSRKTRKKSNVQKVFAASMLSSFIKDEEAGPVPIAIGTSAPIEPEPLTPADTLPHAQPNLPEGQQPPTKAPTPPYTLILIGIILLILWRKGHIKLST